MKNLLVILFVTLLPWISAHAHPGAHGKSLSPEEKQAHAELLKETTYLIATHEQAEEKTTEKTQDTEKPVVTKPESDGIRVSVLGYHDFSSTKKATEMRMPTKKFRQQMQAIKDLGLKVISLDDFMAWKRGEKKIADKSILITIDDGWKAVYTEAYPILKEFGYPFTLFLYTNYIDGGGSALTTPMIKEMQKNGCSLGSHSISHPYPVKIKAERAKGTKSFTKYLHHEMGKSKKSLEQQFKQKITTYAYPGGYVTDEMLPVAKETGYQCLFTVLPAKVINSAENLTLPRYVILGTHDKIFSYATSFKATSTSEATQGGVIQSTPHPVSPKPGALAINRLPMITADLSKVENIDPESITMRVAGFGKVPANFDSDKQTISWKINRRLRSRTCEVSVQWRLLEEKKYQKPMTWVFRVNRKASYQPQSAPNHSQPAAPTTSSLH